MRRPRVVAAAVSAVVALLVGTACDAPAPPRGTPPEGRCDGVGLDDVRRSAEAPAPHDLLVHAASDAVCQAWWVPDLARGFVPQGLVVRGGLATIVGHDGSAPIGLKACQALVLDLRSGRVVRRLDRLDPPPGSPVSTWCRHGGGAAASDAGLWVVETTRLWLLDPATLEVRRAWRLGEGVRGSTLVATSGRIGIAGYTTGGPGRIRWYDERAVLDDGATLLAAGRDDVGVAPESVGRTAARLQGLAAVGEDLWQVSSRTACGLLTLPSGSGSGSDSGLVVGFVPGAEGLQVDDHDVWVVSESSASLYRSTDEPLVPALLRLDRAQVEDGDAPACSF